MTSIRRPIPGFEGLYEASEQGFIYSCRAERELKGCKQGEYLVVSLSVSGVKTNIGVHRAVLMAFQGTPPPDKPQALHSNGNPLDNRRDNLRWGSAAENMADKLAHGRNHYARREQCSRGHTYTESSVYEVQGGRQCKICSKLRKTLKQSTGLPEGDTRHGTYNGYTHYRCRCVECRAAQQEYTKKKLQGKKNPATLSNRQTA